MPSFTWLKGRKGAGDDEEGGTEGDELTGRDAATGGMAHGV